MKKRLFVGIGVQNPTGMQPLPGVHEAIKNAGRYAEANDSFDPPILLMDEGNNVVSDQALRNNLSAEVLIDRPRIVVYFCGHGAFLNGREIWYLSDGQNHWDQRVDVMMFRDMLATYGPKQIAVFSDACKVATVHTAGATPVLRGATGTRTFPQVDIFRATIDGKAAFATQTDGPLFSKAIADVLIDKPPFEALDRQYLAMGKFVVTNQSLANYVEANLPDYAALAGELQHPEIATGFRYDKDDYRELSPNQYQVTSNDAETIIAGADQDEVFQDIADDNENIEHDHGDNGDYVADNTNLARVGRETASSNTNRVVQMGQSVFRTRRASEAAIDASHSEWRSYFWQSACVAAENLAQTGRLIVFLKQPNLVKRSVQLYLPDGKIKRTAGSFHALGGTFVAFDISLNGEQWNSSYSAGVLQVDHLFAPLQFNDTGELAQIISFNYPTNESSLPEGIETLGWYKIGRGAATHDRLGPMEVFEGFMSGTLGVDMVAPIASRLRRSKHSDPMFGIVSGYLYDRAGDVDSIRRLCSFYPQHGQKIPFDIALLSGLDFRQEGESGFRIDIPAVAQDEEAKEAGLPNYVWQQMQAHENLSISGFAPALQAGWLRLPTLTNHPLVYQLAELLPALTNAPFATLSSNILDMGKLVDQMKKNYGH